MVFLRRLDQALEEVETASWPSRLFSRIPSVPVFRMSPVYASTFVIVAAIVLLVLIWQRNPPAVSAKVLLDEAVHAEAKQANPATPGVIYQKIRIETKSTTLERSLYRDAARHRTPRAVALKPEEQLVRNQLETAGVDWQEPLSATDFRDWRDRQPGASDRVAQSTELLLSLTTSIPSGPIARETLTVRADDFHPIGRTIEMRNEDRIEIAELNYAVLGWNDVNEALFQPINPAAPVKAAIHLPRVPSDLELDEAELAARVTLNQLIADTGEQLHVTRTAAGVKVDGVVDSNTRKQELVSHLSLLPHVRCSIVSLEESLTQTQLRSSSPGDQSLSVYSVEAQLSPLEQYLREKRLPLDQFGRISESLLDESLKIRQAEVHLAELQQSFTQASRLPPDQQNRLQVLAGRYLDALQAGLDANQRTLGSIGLDDAEQPSSGLPSDSLTKELDAQVERYQKLCQQLIGSGNVDTKSAVVIAGDLKASNSLIRVGVSRIYTSVLQSVGQRPSAALIGEQEEESSKEKPVN